MAETVLYVVRSWVGRKVEEEWDVWHSQQHMRDVARQLGVLKASKFRTASSEGESAEYWTIYELENLGAFEKYDKSRLQRS